MKAYIGHPLQVCGVEEMRLVGGKGDGMRILQVRNAAGVAFTLTRSLCGYSPLYLQGRELRVLCTVRLCRTCVL